MDTLCGVSDLRCVFTGVGLEGLLCDQGSDELYQGAILFVHGGL